MLKLKRAQWLERANVLTEALPNMRRYAGQLVVIKYGGNAMENDDKTSLFAQDIALLRQVGVKTVIVHGGGPQISKMTKRLGIKSSYHHGVRVTDEETLNVAEMVLGQINKNLAATLAENGVKAIGLSGKDAGWVTAGKLNDSVDLGRVGEVTAINPEIITTLTDSGFCPVVAPIARGSNGQSYNINGDSMAGAVASALSARRLLMLSDVDGVYDSNGNYLYSLTISDCQNLIKSKVADGGMIPKLKCCINAIRNGVSSAAILNGKISHSILLELFTDIGGGSLITPDSLPPQPTKKL